MNALISLGYDTLSALLNPSPRDRAILAEIRLAHLALDRESEQVAELFERLESDFNIRFDLDRLDVDENLEEVRIMKAHWVCERAEQDASFLNRYLGWLKECANAIGDENLEALPANVKALVEARDERDRLWTYLFAFREVLQEHLGHLPSDKPLDHGELSDAVIARLKSDRSQINELIATAEGQKRAIIRALGELLSKKLPDGSEQLTVIDADKPWDGLAKSLLVLVEGIRDEHDALEKMNEKLVKDLESAKEQLKAYERVGQGGEKPPAPVVITDKVQPKKPAPAPGRPKKEEAPPRVSLPSWNYVTSPEIMVEYVRVRANGMDHARACREANVDPAERTTVSANMATTVQRAKEFSGVEREEYLSNLLERWRVRASIRRAA